MKRPLLPALFRRPYTPARLDRSEAAIVMAYLLDEFGSTGALPAWTLAENAYRDPSVLHYVSSLLSPSQLEVASVLAEDFAGTLDDLVAAAVALA